MLLCGSRNLVGLNLELDYGTTKQHRPLAAMVTIPIATRAGEYVYDAGPSLGVGDCPVLSAAVATNHGDVCLVDLSCWHQGVEPTEHTVIRRWSQSEPARIDGTCSIACCSLVSYFEVANQ